MNNKRQFRLGNRCEKLKAVTFRHPLHFALCRDPAAPVPAHITVIALGYPMLWVRGIKHQLDREIVPGRNRYRVTIS